MTDLTCRQAEKMVMPYIDGQLDDAGLEEFLTHLQNCPDCREELEITYTVTRGLLQLDDLSDEEEDLIGALEDSISRSWLHVRVKKLLDVIGYAVDALFITGVAVTLIMQIGFWIHG